MSNFLTQARFVSMEDKKPGFYDGTAHRATDCEFCEKDEDIMELYDQIKTMGLRKVYEYLDG